MKPFEKDITRRGALKRLGLLAAAGAILGAPALSSCSQVKKRRLILYFTATGNCLYAARQLADESTTLLSIPQLVREKRYSLEADEIGLVYPIYGHMPPTMVRDFIRKARLSAPYKFAVLTYGNRKCSAVEIWDAISRNAGQPFDYIATLLMVDNWLPNFDMAEQVKINKRIPEQLHRIGADIASRRHWHEPVTAEERQQHAEFLQRSGADPEKGFLMRSERYFTVTDACTDCAVCTEVCPRGNYRLTAGGVKMEGDCDFCFACIQNCPQSAIQFQKRPDDPLIGKGEKNPNARYRNEHVSLWDIKQANRQPLSPGD